MKTPSFVGEGITCERGEYPPSGLYASTGWGIVLCCGNMGTSPRIALQIPLHSFFALNLPVIDSLSTGIDFRSRDKKCTRRSNLLLHVCSREI